MVVSVEQPYLQFLFAKLPISRFALQVAQLVNGFPEIALDDFGIEWPSSWHT
ncbi:MAG: hypothetical protein ABSC65_14720 [Acidobacteriaceae bacterium]|jgi:hypothetical protein